MWAYEHTIETTTAPEAIWRRWADVAGWGTWNRDIEKVELRGPFAVGSEISMIPVGQNPIVLRIAELVDGELFVDEAEVEGLTLRTMHRIEPLDENKSRILYRMEITGPGADEFGPQIGPAITADFPQTMAALVAL